ncbi:Integrator complex subunit 10 [Homalodisca vitripennis]|nr:Integrator complex subunit 10 [Homalodisca vitripennis]
MTEKKPTYAGAKLWNVLPEHLRKTEKQQFRQFSNNERLWLEIQQLMIALRSDHPDDNQTFLCNMFNHLPPEVQHELLLVAADHSEDTMEHCRLMLLLLNKFPATISQHGRYNTNCSWWRLITVETQWNTVASCCCYSISFLLRYHNTGYAIMSYVTEVQHELLLVAADHSGDTMEHCCLMLLILNKFPATISQHRRYNTNCSWWRLITVRIQWNTVTSCCCYSTSFLLQYHNTGYAIMSYVTEVQHELLLVAADHSEDTMEHCRLMLLLLNKFPAKISQHGRYNTNCSWWRLITVRTQWNTVASCCCYSTSFLLRYHNTGYAIMSYVTEVQHELLLVAADHSEDTMEHCRLMLLLLNKFPATISQHRRYNTNCSWWRLITVETQWNTVASCCCYSISFLLRYHNTGYAIMSYVTEVQHELFLVAADHSGDKMEHCRLMLLLLNKFPATISQHRVCNYVLCYRGTTRTALVAADHSGTQWNTVASCCCYSVSCYDITTRVCNYVLCYRGTTELFLVADHSGNNGTCRLMLLYSISFLLRYHNTGYAIMSYVTEVQHELLLVAADHSGDKMEHCRIMLLLLNKFPATISQHRVQHELFLVAADHSGDTMEHCRLMLLLLNKFPATISQHRRYNTNCSWWRLITVETQWNTVASCCCYSISFLLRYHNTGYAIMSYVTEVQHELFLVAADHSGDTMEHCRLMLLLLNKFPATISQHGRYNTNCSWWRLITVETQWNIVQHDVLVVADHSGDTMEHCRLMLLLLNKFPATISQHGSRLVDLLVSAEKHEHEQAVNCYRKLLGE